MNPILLQKQLRENSADLDDFYKELKSWGEDMKRKDNSLRRHPNNKESDGMKQKTLKNVKPAKGPTGVPANKPKSKTGFTDYSAWEKFDVDAECEKIDYDENEDSELTDECDDSLKDQACAEKEKGNKFVKSQKWDEAITCYSRAIHLFAYDPIFYANRALCYLKTERNMEAEVDCTMSLKLDDTYVKAYQRRAAAREAMHKLTEAEADLVRVLELEVNNKESKNCLKMLRKKIVQNQEVKESVQRPVSKFTASRNQRKGISNLGLEKVTPIFDSNIHSNSDHVKVIDSGNTNSWPSGEDNIILVKSVKKPVHLQSKKPLKRVDIKEVADDARHKNQHNASGLSAIIDLPMTIKTDDLKIIERHLTVESHEVLKETKNYENTNKMREVRKEPIVPQNSVQFYSCWRHLKTIEDKYGYIKLIEPGKLSEIFKESLESDTLSEILEICAKCFIDNNEKVFDFLQSFTRAKRFSTFTMFMNSVDKKNLWKLFDYIRKYENRSKEEVDLLMQLYEL